VNESAPLGGADPLALPGDAASDELTRPASEADIRRVYLDATAMGYAINAVGPVTAYIAAALALTASQAGLHSAAVATGLLAAGAITERLDLAIGTPRIHIAALTLLALSFLALALALSLTVTLIGAFGVGLGFGMMLSHVNATMTAGGGPLARVRTARGTLIAQVSGLAGPIVLGTCVAIGVGWGWVAAPVVVIVGLALVRTRGRNYRPIPPAVGGGRLTRAYWNAWLFVVVVSAIEWAVMFWASTLVKQQTGVPLGDATLVISAILAGTIAARVALSVPAIGNLQPIRVLRVGLPLLLLGSLVGWLATSFPLSLVGFFMTGVGSGSLFPLGVALAMETSPRRPQLASSRLVLAPGLGMLALPPILGVLADASGVSTAWLLVPFVCLVSLVLTIPMARDREASWRAQPSNF
jgi:MFS family permease